MHRLAAFCAAALIALPSLAIAQTAEDRAGELKAWREQCSDPDADLRLAYLEAAIETGDASVIRVCVRQSLESDNADVRNLGLRAALASIEQLAFEVKIPAVLESALKKAAGNEKKLNEIYRWYEYRDWTVLQTGLVMAIAEADVAAAKSTWYALAGLSAAHDTYVGAATVIGDKVNWVGRANLSQGDCKMTLKLVPGPALAGQFQCANITPFEVTAPLL